MKESFPQRGDREKSQGAFFSARGVETPIETHPKYPLGKTLAAMIITIILCLFFCSKGKEGKEEKLLPTQITTDFVMEESESGKRLYRIYAAKALFYEEEGVIEVSSPKVYFFSGAYLTAESGRVLIKTRDLVAKGFVKVSTEDSNYLFTDSLVWNNRAQRIETDAHIRIKSPLAEIEGEGLISDANLSRITIKSGVKGTANYQFK